MKVLAIAVLSVALVGGCDKGEKAPKASGPIGGNEVVLLESLPAGGNVVFGGNYMKLQNLMQTALGDAMANMGPGWKEWITCWSGMSQMKMAGTVSIEGDAEMRMAFNGVTLAEMKKCADAAKFKATLDADGKYLSTEVVMMGQSVPQGMLMLPNGVLYSRQSIALGGGAGKVVPASRAELEGDIAQLSKGKAIDDPKLKALVTRVDRSKTMWFAGTGAGTPIADKLGEVYGTFELANGITMDVTAQLLDSAMLDKAMEMVPQMKKSAAQMPSEMRGLIENLSITRSGDRLHVGLKLSDKQIATLMKQMSAFGGGAGAGGGM